MESRSVSTAKSTEFEISDGSDRVGFGSGLTFNPNPTRKTGSDSGRTRIDTGGSMIVSGRRGRIGKLERFIDSTPWTTISYSNSPSSGAPSLDTVRVSRLGAPESVDCRSIVEKIFKTLWRLCSRMKVANYERDRESDRTNLGDAAACLIVTRTEGANKLCLRVTAVAG
ncbi:hypothetical protein AXG93_799s1010 [Marchantia polymorpha subsp. ruderalis]|uniref:Uncharacterized protein n=1 Tax=Marchantia polymorpha subsp. ruderalis TaxID=1480154 RepID=A0A176VEL2_MARPO|nr:hypothetical protein AXG93_799s1010 [Marchantia polymorpha subsp. ruderalis]